MRPAPRRPVPAAFLLAALALTATAAHADPEISGLRLPPRVEAILQDILTRAELSSVKVTSTDRTARGQAKAMLRTIRARGVAAAHRTYGPAGDKVIDTWVANRRLRRSRLLDRMEAVVKAEVARMNRAASEGVKRTQLMHVNSPHFTFDVAPSSVEDRARFEAAVRADSRVVRFLTPGAGERAYHLEVARPGSSG